MEKKLTMDIKLPSVPNFICSMDGRSVLAITNFSTKELEEIGKEWTKALIKKARNRKKLTQPT